MSDVEVVPAADLPFEIVARAFGERGDPARCWCQWFRMSNRDFDRTSAPDLRAALAEQIGEPHGVGLVALDDGEPAGWVAVAPRPVSWRLRRLAVPAQGTTQPDFDDESIWAITCFVVPPRKRRSGIASALADAATRHALEQGARVVEAYPVDPMVRGKSAAADLYHGTVSMFEACGFHEVGRPKPDRVVMQRRR